MPSLSSLTSSTAPVKLLLLGQSGAGKSGSLASLAAAGYRLRILAYDDGLSVLASHLRATCPAALENVSAVLLSDSISQKGTTQVFSSTPKAFVTGLSLCDNWKIDEEDLGSPSSWTNKDVLVVDSLTRMSQAALNYALSLNGQGPFDVQIQHYNVAQNLIERFIQKLVSSSLPCNVVIIAHLTYWFEQTTKTKSGDTTVVRAAATAEATADVISKAFPAALGRALSPKIMSYVNDALLAETTFKANKLTRVLRTQPTPQLDLKSSIANPPASFPLETGLAEYFRLCRGE